MITKQATAKALDILSVAFPIVQKTCKDRLILDIVHAERMEANLKDGELGDVVRDIVLNVRRIDTGDNIVALIFNHEIRGERK